MKAQLETPLAYEEDLDESFSSLTFSCSASGYEVYTPTSYALNSTTALPESAPMCARAYLVAEGDTCESIDLVQSVSMHAIVSRNALGVTVMVSAPERPSASRGRVTSTSSTLAIPVKASSRPMRMLLSRSSPLGTESYP